jgi:V/A-type H+/Na+-transporting ATPase subunit B
MSEATNLYAVKNVIRIIRNQRVILDSDLAKLYGVPAKRLNEAVKRNSKRFGTSLAQVIRSTATRLLQVFAGGRGIATDARCASWGTHAVPFSDDLLGRVFTGGASRATTARPSRREPDRHRRPVGQPGQAHHPAQHGAHRHPDDRRVQHAGRIAEAADLLRAGEPYNPLLARIALQAEVDVIVLGGMGLKHDDYLYFRDTLEESGALSRTVMFVHTAADPVVECLLVPDIAWPWPSSSPCRASACWCC